MGWQEERIAGPPVKPKLTPIRMEPFEEHPAKTERIADGSFHTHPQPAPYMFSILETASETTQESSQVNARELENDTKCWQEYHYSIVALLNLHEASPPFRRILYLFFRKIQDQTIITCEDYLLRKTEFCIAETRESRKSSGNRCGIAAHKNKMSKIYKRETYLQEKAPMSSR